MTRVKFLAACALVALLSAYSDIHYIGSAPYRCAADDNGLHPRFLVKNRQGQFLLLAVCDDRAVQLQVVPLIGQE